MFYDAQEEERELYEDLRFETKNAGKWFSIAAIVVPTLTFAMSYPISIYVNNSKMHYPYYFLSSSIDHAPASCVGSFWSWHSCHNLFHVAHISLHLDQVGHCKQVSVWTPCRYSHVRQASLSEQSCARAQQRELLHWVPCCDWRLTGVASFSSTRSI